MTSCSHVNRRVRYRGNACVFETAFTVYWMDDLIIFLKTNLFETELRGILCFVFVQSLQYISENNKNNIYNT